MLKKISLSLVLLAVGIGIGFKMPRGAGLNRHHNVIRSGQ